MNVTLVSGKVRFSLEHRKFSSVIMRPGETVFYMAIQDSIIKKNSLPVDLAKLPQSLQLKTTTIVFSDDGQTRWPAVHLIQLFIVGKCSDH